MGLYVMRKIELSRDEGELLTDLLMLSDDGKAKDLSDYIRIIFGMISEEEELAARGLTLAEFRRQWAERLFRKID